MPSLEAGRVTVYRGERLHNHLAGLPGHNYQAMLAKHILAIAFAQNTNGNTITRITAIRYKYRNGNRTNLYDVSATRTTHEDHEIEQIFGDISLGAPFWNTREALRAGRKSIIKNNIFYG